MIEKEMLGQDITSGIPMKRSSSLGRPEAVLVLEDGFVLTGKTFNATGRTLGEVVLTTGTTGYQESLTNPNCHKQTPVTTAPHIGNTGMNTIDPESSQIWVAGFVIRDPTRQASNWRAEGELEDELAEQGIVGICDLGARTLISYLRERGSLYGGIFSSSALPAGTAALKPRTTAALQDIVLDSPLITRAAPTSEVITKTQHVLEPGGEHADKPPMAALAMADLDVKSHTLEILASPGAQVHILPASSSLEDLRSIHPDGVFFSNGPGDSRMATHEIDLLRVILDTGMPCFGTYFGNQLLGRVPGYDTYKLTYGHRGVNQPVPDQATGKVEIIAYSRGSVADMPLDGASVTSYHKGWCGRAEVTHLALNDSMAKELQCLDIPTLSMQCRPEAVTGPHNAGHLFTGSLDLMLVHRVAYQGDNK